MSRKYVHYYGLDEKPCSQEEAFKLFGDGNKSRQIASDYIGNIHVSTVFLVINHQFGDGPPILYETMVFGGKHDEYQRRYSTRLEAEVGHIETTWMVEGRFAQWLSKVRTLPSTVMFSVKRLVVLLKLKLGIR